MKPILPSATDIFPYLERIDAAHTYSNFGPLYHELVDRMAAHFGVRSGQVALLANGTLALQAAIETVGDPGDTWVAPSWTFVATGQAILSARRRIHFVDVDASTWALNKDAIPFARGRVAVAPFGSRPDLEAWESSDGYTVVDAASCFDSAEGIGRHLGGSTMVMVSLHATKTFGVGEGAVLFGPEEWIQRVSKWANFGFAGSRIASGPGMNGKFSEYQAAVGLAGLDTWPSVRCEWLRRLELARSATSALGLKIQPSFTEGWITSTWNVVLPSESDLQVVADQLKTHGIATRVWWPMGVHQMPAFERQTSGDLTTTNELVLRVLGLPFGRHLDEPDFDEIHRVLSLVLD